MDDGGGMLEILVLGCSISLCAYLDKGAFKRGVFLSGKRVLLQDDQVAAHLRPGIVGKEVIGQADSREQPGLVHQVLPHRVGHGGVHHPLRGDEGDDAAFTDGIQPFCEEIVVQGVQRKTLGRTVVEGRIENAYVAERDVAAHHVEIAVVLRGQFL